MAFSVKIGDSEVVALRDGHHPLNWGWHFPEVGGEQEECLLNFGGFLVITGSTVTLVDTGWGPYAGPPGGLDRDCNLLEEMASVGIGPGDVDLVAMTHLHPDHIGWNLILEDRVRPRFTKARYLVPRADWEHYKALPEKHPNIVQQAMPLEDLGVLELIEDGHAVTSSLKAVAMPGHTPGHTGFLLDAGCFLLGDLAHHPHVLEETGWIQRFDWNPELAVESRERVFEQVERDGTLVGLGHFPYPSLGHVIKNEGRRQWKPL
ncbi:MBL fold metallo-hydrolase [Rhizohabitans arisaemae]|uniref:MBL fold metallo-hydrolase n=1 Tax=Rhizohabitans arisaemae TaxID=2720610 RepID=UPI0024B1FCB3|nr:MBL fold metallo-hydrolase [Rhizohabitans arisaemae]